LNLVVFNLDVDDVVVGLLKILRYTRIGKKEKKEEEEEEEERVGEKETCCIFIWECRGRGGCSKKKKKSQKNVWVTTKIAEWRSVNGCPSSTVYYQVLQAYFLYQVTIS